MAATQQIAFDLIPSDQLRIDHPDFKAGKWRPVMIRGERWMMAQCYEWIGGKWEGFVSICKQETREAQ